MAGGATPTWSVMPWILTTGRRSGRFEPIDDGDDEYPLNGFACVGRSTFEHREQSSRDGTIYAVGVEHMCFGPTRYRFLNHHVDKELPWQ